MKDETPSPAAETDGSRPRQQILNIVVPCYNEEEVLPDTAQSLSELLDRMSEQGMISPDSGIYFVDDGSADHT